jgi:hypothetical protein
MLPHLARAVGPLLVLVACGGAVDDAARTSTSVPSPSASATTTPASEATGPSTSSQAVQPCADVIQVRHTAEGDTFRFDVTVRSGDTGWDKYADAWEVRAPDGTVLGERVLAHPHESEQPFTRSLTGVVVPSDVDEVVVAARDSVNGYCGTTETVAIQP